MPAEVAEPHSLDQANCGGSGDTAAAAVAPKRKVRMHPADVRFVMTMKREELGGTEYLDALAHRYTPEEIEEMRRLHEELAALYLKDNDEIEARQAQIARELSEKGYVEVDAPPDDDNHDAEVDLEEERRRWGDNLEDYDEWASEAEFDRWAQAFWDKKVTNKLSAGRINVADPGDDKAAVGWIVRPFDAENEEEQYGDEYEDSHAYQELEAHIGEEDEGGDDKINEGEHNKEEEEE